MATPENSAVPFTTKSQFVYEKLRGRIVSGENKPGERLILRKVAAMAGTSLVPVREALKKLEADGLVTQIPHVGARIATPDLEKIEETLLIRASLEILGVQVTLPHFTEADFEALDAIILETRWAVEHKDPANMNRLNREFHLRLYQPCPLPRLKKMIEDLWDESQISSNLLEFIPQRARQNLAEHRRLVHFLRKRDVNNVEVIIITQRENAKSALRNQFQSKGESKCTSM